MTIRSEVTTWIKSYINGKDEIQIPDVAQKAIYHFQGQPDFMKRLLAEQLNMLVREITQDIIGNTRSRYLVLGDEVVTRDTAKKKAKKHPIFSKWLEHVYDRHILFMEMDKASLLIAANERQARGETELTIARLERHIAGKLELEERVKDKFTPEAVDKLYRDFQAERSNLQNAAD